MTERRLSTRTCLLAAVRTGVAITAFVVLIVSVLRSTSTTVYGFAVSADPYVLTERGLQIGPLFAALTAVAVVGLGDDALAAIPHYGRTSSAMVKRILVNALLLAALYAIATVATIASLIIWLDGEGLPVGTMVLLASYVVDLCLDMILLQFLHAWTRRWYLTLILLVAYAASVLVLGSATGTVDLIGFGTTPAVTLVDHDAWPIGLEAAWWWRLYWLLVTGILIILLTAFYRPPEPLIRSLSKFRLTTISDVISTKRRAVIAMLVLLCAAIVAANGLSVRKRMVAGRYPVVTRERTGPLPLSTGRATLLRFNVRVDARLDARQVAISGTEVLRNDTGRLLTTLVFEKAPVFSLTDLGGAGLKNWSIRDGRMVLVPLQPGLPPGGVRVLHYRGGIDAGDPFDATARSLVMPHAFFLRTPAILPMPRRPACFAGQAGVAACNQNENYQLGDASSGRIEVTAPADVIVSGGDRSIVADGRVRSSLAIAPRALGNVLIAASRYRSATFAATPSSPAITVYGAPYGKAGLDRIAAYARGAFQDYTAIWGAVPPRQVWIAETPASLLDAEAYENGFAVSERYFARHARGSSAISDATRMILSHEIAHQWWGYSLVPAKAPGSAFVLESFAQFAGLSRLHREAGIGHAVIIAGARLNVAKGVKRDGKPKEPLYAIEKPSWRAYYEGPLALALLDDAIGGTLLERMGHVLQSPEIAGRRTVLPALVVDALVDEVREQPRAKTKRDLTAAR